MRYSRLLSTYVPFRDKLEENLRYAGYADTPVHKIASAIFITSYISGFIAFLITFFPLGHGLLVSLGAWVATILAVEGIAYMIIVFKGDTRADQVDEILPDALQLMSANVRSGMTIDQAIWLAARPEFGPLEDEIKRVSTEVAGAASLQDALEEMTTRINSTSLERAVRLINEGLKGGGEMAKLLDQVAADIRAFQAMEEEASATTTTYTIFIVMASILGAPLLFGISSFFIDVIDRIFTSRVIPQAEGTGTGTGLLSISAPQVDPGFVQDFMVAAVIIIAFFSSLIVGLIKTGEEKNGLKYAPFIIGFGLLVFFITQAAVQSVFGSIITI